MRFYQFAIIIVGMIAILNLAGYVTPVTGGLMKTMGIIESGTPDVSSFEGTTFWSTLITVLGLAATVGIVIGAFARAPDISYILAGLVSLLAGAILRDYISIISKLTSFGLTWVSGSVGIFLTALLVGFFITTINFWRGTDN